MSDKFSIEHLVYRGQNNMLDQEMNERIEHVISTHKDHSNLSQTSVLSVSKSGNSQVVVETELVDSKQCVELDLKIAKELYILVYNGENRYSDFIQFLQGLFYAYNRKYSSEGWQWSLFSVLFKLGTYVPLKVVEERNGIVGLLQLQCNRASGVQRIVPNVVDVLLRSCRPRELREDMDGDGLERMTVPNYSKVVPSTMELLAAFLARVQNENITLEGTLLYDFMRLQKGKKGNVSVKTLKVQGLDYCQFVMEKLIQLEWNKDTVMQWIILFREIRIGSKDLHVMFAKKVLKIVASMDADALPTICYQLLVFSGQTESLDCKKIILNGIVTQMNILEKKCRPTNEDAIHHEMPDAGEVAAAIKKFKYTEANVLAHFNFIVQRDHNLGAYFIRIVQQTPVEKMVRFLYVLIFSIGCHNHYEAAVLDTMTKKIIHYFQAMQILRQNNDTWLTIPSATNENAVQMPDMIRQMLQNVRLGSEHILGCVVRLALKLLDTKQAHSNNHVHGFAQNILTDLFTNYPDVRESILENSINETIAKANVLGSPYFNVLDVICQLLAKYTDGIAPCKTHLKHALENVAFLSCNTAIKFLELTKPIWCKWEDLKDTIVLVVRKAMFQQDQDSQVLALHGFFGMLMSFDEQSIVASTLSSQALHTTENSSANESVTNFFYDCSGFLRRCLSGQYRSRASVYYGMESLLEARPFLQCGIVEVAWPHFENYLSSNDQDSIPLNLSACMKHRDANKEMVEFFPFLLAFLYSIDRRMETSDPIIAEDGTPFDIRSCISRIVEKLSSVSVESLRAHVKVNDASEFVSDDNTADQLVLWCGVLHSTINHCVLSSLDEDKSLDDDKADLVLKWFDICEQLITKVKKPASRSKKQKGKANENESRTTSNSGAKAAAIEQPEVLIGLQSQIGLLSYCEHLGDSMDLKLLHHVSAVILQSLRMIDESCANNMPVVKSVEKETIKDGGGKKYLLAIAPLLLECVRLCPDPQTHTSEMSKRGKGKDSPSSTTTTSILHTVLMAVFECVKRCKQFDIFDEVMVEDSLDEQIYDKLSRLVASLKQRVPSLLNNQYSSDVNVIVQVLSILYTHPELRDELVVLQQWTASLLDSNFVLGVELFRGLLELYTQIAHATKNWPSLRSLLHALAIKQLDEEDFPSMEMGETISIGALNNDKFYDVALMVLAKVLDGAIVEVDLLYRYKIATYEKLVGQPISGSFFGDLREISSYQEVVYGHLLQMCWCLVPLLHLAINLRVDVAVLRMLVKVYKSLCSMVKFKLRETVGDIPEYVNTVLKYAASELSPQVLQYISVHNVSHAAEQTEKFEKLKAGKRKEAAVAPRSALIKQRSTLVPEVIFQLEQLDLVIFKFSKKFKIGEAMEWTSRRQARDFRINADALQKELEESPQADIGTPEENPNENE